MSGERVERRLAAILAADVAGYSRLMGADEEGTLARLKAHAPRADRPEDRRAQGPHRQDHRRRPAGRVPERRRRGALRGRGAARRWPSATPGTAEDQRIEFRIGINLGDVIVEDGDIFGDGVNVAARLEALAEPGGICVSAMVHDQVRDKLDLRLRGYGRAAAQEHRPAGAGLPSAARPLRARPTDRRRPRPHLTPRRSPTSRRSRCCPSRT